MDPEGFSFGAFIAAEEKRRAEKKAQDEKLQLKAQYDQWCLDHGVPPPPASNTPSRSHSEAGASVWLGLSIIGIVFLFVLWLISR